MYFRDILALAPNITDFVSSMPSQLDGRFTVREYEPYSIISQKENELDHIGILLSGTFRTINEFENGNVFMIEVNEPISFVGEITLFAKKGVTSVTLESVTKCTVAYLPVEIFSAWIDSDIHFLRRMTEHIASKLYVSSYNRGERLFYSSSYIFIKTLLSWAEAEDIEQKERIAIRHTREQMSQILGLQEKTINRIIAKLKEEGAISMEKGKITLTRDSYNHLKTQLPVYREKSRNGAF